MRTPAAALITSIALAGLSTSVQAQSPYGLLNSSTIPPRTAEAAAPAPAAMPQPKPAPTDASVRPAVTATTATAAKPPGAYWGPPAPPAPKRRQTLVRRFYNWVVGPEDTVTQEEGVKVYRDPATGRTNVLGSKPWTTQDQ